MPNGGNRTYFIFITGCVALLTFIVREVAAAPIGSHLPKLAFKATRAKCTTVVCGEDASSLLQTGVQQPNPSASWNPWNQMKEESLSMVGPMGNPGHKDDFGIPKHGHGVNGFAIDFDQDEWDATAPEYLEPQIDIDGTAGKDNLCIHGRFVPELLLVGVVKSGTTTFAANIRESNNVYWPSIFHRCQKPSGYCINGSTKEGHFFDNHFSKGLEYMTSSFGKCRYDVRLVATDMSPRYLIDHRVPGRIAQTYGGLKDMLKMVLILREPVARFHSDYWHAVAAGWCPKYGDLTFQDVVKQIVLQDKYDRYIGGYDGCTDRLEGSLYKRAITRWFDNFQPSQFTVVPFLYNVAPGVQGRFDMSCVKHTWDILGVKHGKLFKSRRLNKHSHPRLEHDLSLELRKKFRQWIWLKNSPTDVAKALMNPPGARFFGFKGNQSNLYDVSFWLRANW